jgi:hypothetical protein
VFNYNDTAVYNNGLAATSTGTIVAGVNLIQGQFTYAGVSVTAASALFLMSVRMTGADGSSAANAGTSAAAIKALTGTNANGVYWINLPTVGPKPIYCIMDSTVDGGGWMMALKTSGSGSTFCYTAGYWTNFTTLNASDTTRNANDAKYDTFHYFSSKDLLAIWPDIAYSGGTFALPSASYGNVWCWEKKNYYGGSSQTLQWFFSSVNNYTFFGPPSSYPISYPYCPEAGNSANPTVFSQQPLAAFYGANSTACAGKQTRWGMVYNENSPGDFGSADVCGGIGLGTNTGNMSSGDFYGCCGNIGINRGARVEMYVR